MDNAKNGVIYFSMGGNLKSANFPKKLRNDILKVFSTLQQTVIWKFEGTLTNLSRNVHVVSWAPQHSILGNKIIR